MTRLPAAVAGVTWAVKVTDVPYVAGFADEVTVVVELALFTVCVIAAEVLPPNGDPFALPCQTAVIWWVPTVKVLIAALEQDPFLRVQVPMEEPSL